MAGTKAGGAKAAATNRERHGENFYNNIGRAGGTKSRGGGFAKDPELARIAGQKGGKISKRHKIEKPVDEFALLDDIYR
jgi:general stress protein YciG